MSKIFENLTILDVVKNLKEKKFTCKELVEYYISNIKKYKDKNAVLEIFDDAIINAEKVDKLLEKNTDDLPKLIGVPIIIKDNILYKGKIASCGSKFLQNYTAQYTSTVMKKLLDAGVIVLGRANMDEFAMGGSCENSAFGACKNAFDDERVSGGSSGGSAVAVALDLCTFALGSDTGGSVRQPSAFNGLIGMKPTYGRVSRFGLVAYACSFDQIGPITKTVKDNALVLSIIAGKDYNDETSLASDVPNYLDNLKETKNIKIGILKETNALISKTEYNQLYDNIKLWFKSQGASITEFSVPFFDLCLPIYYILTPAEACSNLGRFDGIKYTTRSEKSENIDELYLNSRTEGFGKEVQRRIMLGNFVLSSGYYDAYYLKAMKVRKALQTQFKSIFEKCDILILPTTFKEAFKIGSKFNNPVEMYVEDIFTSLANIIGNPAISIPCGKGKHGLPLGLQIIADNEKEQTLYNVSEFFVNNYREGK